MKHLVQHIENQKQKHHLMNAHKSKSGVVSAMRPDFYKSPLPLNRELGFFEEWRYLRFSSFTKA